MLTSCVFSIAAFKVFRDRTHLLHFAQKASGAGDLLSTSFLLEWDYDTRKIQEGFDQHQNPNFIDKFRML